MKTLKAKLFITGAGPPSNGRQVKILSKIKGSDSRKKVLNKFSEGVGTWIRGELSQNYLFKWAYILCNKLNSNFQIYFLNGHSLSNIHLYL